MPVSGVVFVDAYCLNRIQVCFCPAAKVASGLLTPPFGKTQAEISGG